ncbi:MAG: hypothetical protein O2816_02705 [Planctomycetota bacterium]|nr:hypothetical protein [Planctomycetota bacterium]
MDTIENVDKLFQSGTRFTFTMLDDEKPDEDDIKAALKSKKVAFVSLTKETRTRATVAYSIECPGFT